MKATIFFSWQSDSLSSIARGPIEMALGSAVASLSTDITLVVRPTLDSDTRNVPGSPDMARTILSKIDACSVFVADVSLVYDRPDGKRRSPNPNVMLELGYALKRLGTERIILLMNAASGRPEDLPFDLRGHRIVTYDSGQAASVPSQNIDALADTLLKELRFVLQMGMPIDLSPVDLTISYSVRDQRSDRHEYRLLVQAHNRSEDILANWAVVLRFPMRLLEPNQQYPLLPRHGQPSRGKTNEMAVMRLTQQEHSREIYPDEKHPVFGIDYYVDDDIYEKRHLLFPLMAEATFFIQNKQVAVARKEISDLQSY